MSALLSLEAEVSCSLFAGPEVTGSTGPPHREAGNPARPGWGGPHGRLPCAGCCGSGPVQGPRERTGLAGNPAPAGRTRRSYAGRASAERRQSELLGREFEHFARRKGGDGSQLAAFETQMPAPSVIGL